jgi:hypothetical protein
VAAEPVVKPDNGLRSSRLIPGHVWRRCAKRLDLHFTAGLNHLGEILLVKKFPKTQKNVLE